MGKQTEQNAISSNQLAGDEVVKKVKKVLTHTETSGQTHTKHSAACAHMTVVGRHWPHLICGCWWCCLTLIDWPSPE